MHHPSTARGHDLHLSFPLLSLFAAWPTSTRHKDEKERSNPTDLDADQRSAARARRQGPFLISLRSFQESFYKYLRPVFRRPRVFLQISPSMQLKIATETTARRGLSRSRRASRQPSLTPIPAWDVTWHQRTSCISINTLPGTICISIRPEPTALRPEPVTRPETRTNSSETHLYFNETRTRRRSAKNWVQTEPSPSLRSTPVKPIRRGQNNNF